jgi:hypothetical protein
LLSLEFSRIWLGMFGRHPVGFILGVFALHLVIAWGLARLAATFQLDRRGTILMCGLLPWAVIPDYLTFTHPLEAALIVHALAFHAAGRRAMALMLLTVCLFVKPSMAYVYGFVLTLLIFRDTMTRENLFFGDKVKYFFKQLIPAAIAAAVCLGFCLLRYGGAPTKNTLLAVAGASAYRETNFGLFAAGRDFWMPSKVPSVFGVGFLDHVIYYFFNPAGIWIVAVLILFLVGVIYFVGFFAPPIKRPRPQPAVAEIVVTLLLIHSAFLFVFYGWTHSWTYYAYMPFFALALVVSKFNVQFKIAISLIVLSFLCHEKAMKDAFSIWAGGVRTPETSNLFAWENHAQGFKEVIEQTAGKPTLIMTNGYIFNLPANAEMPDAWFPESGIAIPEEIERVAKQATRDEMEYVIVFPEYKEADLWRSPKFAHVREKYRVIQLVPDPKFPHEEDKGKGPPYFRNTHFEIWQRIR